MRELERNAKRSKGRDAHRARYAAYIVSPKWFHRREVWAATERARLGCEQLHCTGCKQEWSLKRGDLHHVTYERLEDEAHDDLWAVCRECHDRLHELMDSSRSWKKLPRTLANEFAVSVLRGELSGESSKQRRRRAVEGLQYYLKR